MSLEISFREKSTYAVKVLHAVDCAAVVAFLWLLTKAYRLPWEEPYTHLCIVTCILCLFVFHSFQLYRSWRGHGLHNELLIICKAWGTVVGLLLFLAFILKVSYAFSRFVILHWFIFTPLLLMILHMAVRITLRTFRSKGVDQRNAVIIGAGELGMRVAEHIENTPWAGITVAGFFDDRKDNGDPTLGEKTILGKIPDLPDYLRNNLVDYVYIALPMRAEEKIFSILTNCRTLGAEVYLVPDLYLFGLFNAQLQSLGDLLLLNFNPYNRWKRYFDVAFALAAIVFTLPLTLLIAACVKLGDGGPIFYGHQRITSTGKVFKCLKFRTMRVDAEQKLKEILEGDPEARAEWKRTFKLKNDPRVTPVGRFLRSTSLDELPQFLNVLKGEMSVVGARPIVYEELDNYYKENAGLYCSTKPGMTGLWQVGKRSDTTDYAERVKLDRYYVLNNTFWLDLKIIVKTLRAMIDRRGAY